MKEKKIHQVTKFDDDDDKSSLKLAPDIKDIKAESGEPTANSQFLLQTMKFMNKIFSF